MSFGNYIHVHVDKIKKETDSAFLCMIGGEDYWIPRSQVADEADYQEGDMDLTLSITEWIANEKGLKGEDA
jgi:hypothetical protein